MREGRRREGEEGGKGGKEGGREKGGGGGGETEGGQRDRETLLLHLHIVTFLPHPRADPRLWFGPGHRQ